MGKLYIRFTAILSLIGFPLGYPLMILFVHREHKKILKPKQFFKLCLKVFKRGKDIPMQYLYDYI